MLGAEKENIMHLTENEIENGFWYRDQEKSFPPKAITYPHEYDGETHINLVCTQLSIGSYQQRKLVDKWCQLIPELQDVRFLWFSSRVNQALLDAACENPNIEGLYVKWSGIKDLSGLRNLPKLRFLHVGSSASVESIDIFSEMDQLIVLEIENFKKNTRVVTITISQSVRRLRSRRKYVDHPNC